MGVCPESVVEAVRSALGAQMDVAAAEFPRL